jgi:hypothetical protein
MVDYKEMILQSQDIIEDDEATVALGTNRRLKSLPHAKPQGRKELI